jgi:hypothetical protein
MKLLYLDSSLSTLKTTALFGSGHWIASTLFIQSSFAVSLHKAVRYGASAISAYMHNLPLSSLTISASSKTILSPTYSMGSLL